MSFNQRGSYDRETGMVTGSGGKSRMAGERMQAFQSKLDSARASGDTEKVNQMREKRRTRGAEMKQNRMDRRSKRQANNATQDGFSLGAARTADFQDSNRNGIDDRDE